MVEISRMQHDLAEAMREAVENNTGHFDGGSEVDWLGAALHLLEAADQSIKEKQDEEETETQE